MIKDEALQIAGKIEKGLENAHDEGYGEGYNDARKLIMDSDYIYPEDNPINKMDITGKSYLGDTMPLIDRLKADNARAWAENVALRNEIAEKNEVIEAIRKAVA